MSNLLHTAEFLHLFSIDECGLKRLTHDDEMPDYVRYIYDCQRLVLDKRLSLDIQDDIYNLVRGFLFGPYWYDSNKKRHDIYAASDAYIETFERTCQHPLKDAVLEKEIDCFRHTIRFRALDLKEFLYDLKARYKGLNIEVKDSVEEADFYTHTKIVKDVVNLIIDSMNEYNTHPNIVIHHSNHEDDSGFHISWLIIEQKGSFPSHNLQRDQDKLKGTNSGTLGTIKRKLDGICEWSVVSKWSGDETSKQWDILTINGQEQVKTCSIAAQGFKHILKFYHKL